MDDTRPKPFAFVLMPFSPDFEDIYKLGIRRACENAGAYAERVDEQIFEGSIVQRIYNQIARADVIVADMTGRNPNVFYEVGYAHALGRPVILLAQSSEDIPFDLKHYTHIIYNRRIIELLPELERRVRVTLAAKAPVLERSARVFVQDVELQGEARIPLVPPGMPLGTAVSIAVHNPAVVVARPLGFQLGLVVERGAFDVEFSAKRMSEGFPLDDRTMLFVEEREHAVWPGGWARVKVGVWSRGGPEVWKEEHRFSVRLFTAGGIEDYPFISIPKV